jgi:hypothetical protein
VADSLQPERPLFFPLEKETTMNTNSSTALVRTGPAWQPARVYVLILVAMLANATARAAFFMLAPGGPSGFASDAGYGPMYGPPIPAPGPPLPPAGFGPMVVLPPSPPPLMPGPPGTYFVDALSAAEKMIYAQIALARAGFSTGGRAPYGFRRWLAKDDGTPIRQLPDGECVRMAGHHVVWLPDPTEELDVIRRILNALKTTPASRVAEILTKEKAPPAGQWTISETSRRPLVAKRNLARDHGERHCP